MSPVKSLSTNESRSTGESKVRLKPSSTISPRNEILSTDDKTLRVNESLYFILCQSSRSLFLFCSWLNCPRVENFSTVYKLSVQESREFKILPLYFVDRHLIWNQIYVVKPFICPGAEFFLPPCTQRLCMKRGWVFEAASCPTWRNVIWKLNYKITLNPSHVLYTLL